MKDLSNTAAVPTQYKGIEYRSKSEAILARCFDLVNEEALSPKYNLGHQAIYYEYEPPRLELPDNYTPDFYLTFVGKVDTQIKINEHIIEYKPSRVTQVYKEKLTKRFQEYGKVIGGRSSILSNSIVKGPWPTLLTGSVYDGNNLTFQLFNPFEGNAGAWCPEVAGWGDFKITHEIIQRAKSYRFDLEDQEETRPVNQDSLFANNKPVKSVPTPPMRGKNGMVKMPSLKDIQAQLARTKDLPF